MRFFRKFKRCVLSKVPVTEAHVNRRNFIASGVGLLATVDSSFGAPVIHGDELVALLGHASKKSPLDEHLKRHNLLKRPRGYSGYYAITENFFGLTFTYKDWPSFEEDFIHEAKSQGDFILTEIDFTTRTTTKERPFTGTLPFGLSFSMPRQTVMAKFSQPVDSWDGDQKKGSIEIFVQDKVMITVAFKPGDQSIDWMRVLMPNKIHRKRGVYP